MPDIVDDAQEAMEIAEQLRQQAAQQFKPVRTGSCIECDEPTKFTFCSVDCRDSYERRQRMKAITGN